MLAANPSDNGTELQDGTRSRLFVHTTLISCLLLQKFGVVLGASYINLGLIVVGPWLMYLYASGLARLRPIARFNFAFIAYATLAALVAALTFDSRSEISVTALVLLIALYGSLCLGPSERFSRAGVTDIFLNYAFVLAILGVVQYAAQFVGVRSIRFAEIMPFLRPVLVEQFFNSVAVVEYGSNVVRANAFVLLEPSTLSQIIVIAAVVELLVKRRLSRLPLYVVAYAVTYSGTGVLSLLVAVAIASFTSTKIAMRSGAALAFALVGVFACYLVLPDLVGRYVERLGEFLQPGTSAYERYVAQNVAWRELGQGSSLSLLTGLGPGSFERYFTPQGMASNALIKITADYGLIAMAIWVLVFFKSFWTPTMPFITILVFCTCIVGGGNELNPIFLFPMAILCVWGELGQPTTSLSVAANVRDAQGTGLRRATPL